VNAFLIDTSAKNVAQQDDKACADYYTLWHSSGWAMSNVEKKGDPNLAGTMFHPDRNAGIIGIIPANK
jgi:hypothetical protein